MKDEFIIDASKLLNLEHSSIFFLILDFLEHLDTDNLDNAYYNVIKDLDSSKLSETFDILSRIYFYVTYLINSKHPEYCSFKVIKYYITKEKMILKIKYKEL